MFASALSHISLSIGTISFRHIIMLIRIIVLIIMTHFV